MAGYRPVEQRVSIMRCGTTDQFDGEALPRLPVAGLNRKAPCDVPRRPPVPHSQFPRLLAVALRRHDRVERDGDRDRVGGLSDRSRRSSLHRGAGGFPARNDRPGTIHTPVPAHADRRAGGRQRRSALDRSGNHLPAAAHGSRLGPAGRHRPAVAGRAVRRRRHIRRDPGLCRAGLFRARAQPGAARKPADGHRGEFDRVAGRVDPGAEPRRISLRGQRDGGLRDLNGAVRHRTRGNLPDWQGATARSPARSPPDPAHRRRVPLCPQ